MLATAEVLDLGQLDQYKAITVRKTRFDPNTMLTLQQQDVPNLGGTTVWVSGKEGDGFDVELSPDAKAKIQGVFDGCGKADDHYYQDARDVLHSTDLQIDGTLERRGFAQLLSKTFRSIADV